MCGRWAHTRTREIFAVESNSSSYAPAGAERLGVGLFDIYLVTDKQLMENQTIINTYTYQVTSAVGDPDSASLAAAFIGEIQPAVRAIQESDSVLHTELRVQNLFDPSDLTVVVQSEAGTGSFGSQPLPTFNAAAFRLQQDNGAVKNGAKRYAGLDEGVQDRGVITSGSYGTALDALADALKSVMVEGIIPTYVPVVVKRLLVGDDYVFPDNLGDAIFGTIVDVAWDALVSSQVSRKVGVGI